MPVAPAVPTARFNDAAGNASGENNKNQGKNKTTHGDPFALGITPP
jgi:hypothetical protein